MSKFNYSKGETVSSCKAITVVDDGNLCTDGVRQTAEVRTRKNVVEHIAPGAAIGTFEGVRKGHAVVMRNGTEVMVHKNHCLAEAAREYRANDTTIVGNVSFAELTTAIALEATAANR